jgi:hypothetical protein
MGETRQIQVQKQLERREKNMNFKSAHFAMEMMI